MTTGVSRSIFFEKGVFCMKALVETTHALSLPGVMARLYWAVFLEKIISREDAKPQRGVRHLRKKRRCGHCRIFYPAGGAAGHRWANVYSPLHLALGGWMGGNGSGRLSESGFSGF
jgi:hypothetical protein